MKALLALIKKLYGSKAIQNTLGTRTNVITLPNKEIKKFANAELNIEAASDAAVKKAYEEVEKLIPDIPKMNDQEILTLTGNLRRLDNRLNPQAAPSAEVIEFGTKKPMSESGIAQLAAKEGLPSDVDPKSPLGNVLRGVQKLRKEKEGLEKMMKESPLKAFEEGVLNNPYRSGGPLDPKVGMVRTAAREILEKNLKAGKINIPDETARDAILKSSQGGVDPIDVLRKTYGEGILEDLDDIAEELNRAKDYKDIQKILQREKLFDAAPKKDYGYDPGVMSDQEMSDFLKTVEPKVIPADSDEGKAITDMILGQPKPKGPKATVTELLTADKIIDNVNKMDPMDGMKEVNKVLKKEGQYKNISEEDANRIVKETEDVIFERNIPEDPEGFAVGGRVGFQRGTPAIFDQLEMDVPFPHGQRVEMAGGGITALKSLIKFLSAQSGKTGSQALQDINPKKLGYLQNMLKKSDKDLLDKNRQDYLGELSDIINSDKKLLDKMKGMPDQEKEMFFNMINEGGNKGRLNVYRDPNFNIDDAISEIEQMKKNLKFKDVPEETVKRSMNANGGLAYLMGL